MAKEKISDKIEKALEEHSKSSAFLAGPGAKKLREIQALIRKMGESPITKGNIKASLRFNKFVRKNKDGEKAYAEFSVIETPVHLTCRSDNLLKDSETFKMIKMKQNIKKKQSELRSFVKVLKAEGNLDLENRLRLRSIENNDSSNLLKEKIMKLTQNMIETKVPEQSALQLSNQKISQTAFHNFSSYVFARDTGHAMMDNGSAEALSSVELEGFVGAGRKIILDVVNTYQPVNINDRGDYLPEEIIPSIPNLAEILYRLFVKYPAATLFELQYRIEEGNGSEVLDAFREWLIVVVKNTPASLSTVDMSCDNFELWKSASKQVESVLEQMYPDIYIRSFLESEDTSYSFIPFDTSMINFGLRITYRQEWTPLGTQPGEIVRTIPLGPKQVEKVSTKVITNEKLVRTAETFTATETNSESSNTTKDSSDIVKEASKSFKWHAETEASGSYLNFCSAKVSAGVGGESASSSKDTKTHLNETMVKTASKMRNESKVVVSIEKSSSEEYSSCSEIVNPNDEIAVTYVYSKLQRQYEIFTKMESVNSVIFIPERVPAFKEVNETWVRKYDWILSKVLLDESFADDLALVVNEATEEQMDMTSDEAKFYYDAAMEAKNSLGKYVTLQGTLPDILHGPQEAYQRQMDKFRADKSKNNHYKKRKERLLGHIRKNILHYMRAIWSAEDPDQRLMRYSQIYVPTLWYPEIDKDKTTNDFKDYVSGEFIPDLSRDSMRKLTDVINPAGPIGYVGNYAIYYMKSDRDLAALNQALSWLRVNYTCFNVSVTPSDLVTYAYAFDPSSHKIQYKLIYKGNDDWTVENTIFENVNQIKSIGKKLEFDGICINLSKLPDVDTIFDVSVFTTGELQDPELREIHRNNPLPEFEDEVSFFSPRLISDMGKFLPDIALSVIDNNTMEWNKLSEETKSRLRSRYHEYILKREHTTQLLLDTNNLILDLDIGKTPALEEFKRLHRAIDVMKELEEFARRQIDNARCKLRIDAGDLSDPNIENMTVISQKSEDDDLGTAPVNVIIPSNPDTGTKVSDENNTKA